MNEITEDKTRLTINAKYLHEKDSSLKIIGIDLSESMIALAKKNVPNVVFEVKDIRQLNYNENQFDHIIAAFCLPFLYDNEAKVFISNIARFVKLNGYIYLSTIMGSGYNIEIPGFSKGRQMFFNYYSKTFLLNEFKLNKSRVKKYILQDYPNNDGSKLKDMIYIVQKK